MSRQILLNSSTSNSIQMRSTVPKWRRGPRDDNGKDDRLFLSTFCYEHAKKSTSHNQINELLNDFCVTLQLQKLNVVGFPPTRADVTNVYVKLPLQVI